MGVVSDRNEELRRRESAAGGDPTLVVGRETAAGNDAVEVRAEMQVSRLRVRYCRMTPAMEHAEEAEFHA